MKAQGICTAPEGMNSVEWTHQPTPCCGVTGCRARSDMQGAMGMCIPQAYNPLSRSELACPYPSTPRSLISKGLGFRVQGPRSLSGPCLRRVQQEGGQQRQHSASGLPPGLCQVPWGSRLCSCPLSFLLDLHHQRNSSFRSSTCWAHQTVQTTGSNHVPFPCNAAAHLGLRHSLQEVELLILRGQNALSRLFHCQSCTDLGSLWKSSFATLTLRMMQ